jgi:hypothetical protein
LWPLTGGSLSVDFHHTFTYVFINLGLGTNATNSTSPWRLCPSMRQELEICVFLSWHSLSGWAWQMERMRVYKSRL